LFTLQLRQLHHHLKGAVGRSWNAQLGAFSHDVPVEKVDLAWFSTRKILSGGRHLVRHSRGNVQDFVKQAILNAHSVGVRDNDGFLREAIRAAIWTAMPCTSFYFSHTATCLDWRAIARVIRAATMQRRPAAKNAGK
jgi:hypothetical protein